MSSDINVQTFSGKVNITSNLLVGSSHLFVDTTNNRVGLVTVNPDAGLHVNSNAYVDTDFRVGPSIVMNDTTGRITAGSFVGDGSGITSVNSDSGSWVNGTDVVYLSTIGDKVGIGTVSPSSIFNTYGGGLWDGTDHTSKVCATLQVGRGSGAGASIQDAGTGAILEFRHHSDYRFVTVESVSEGNYSSVIGIRFKTMDTTSGPEERMRIDAHGNVGIGVTTVDSGIKLQVNGVVKATGFTGIQAGDVPVLDASKITSGTLNQNTTGTSGGITFTELDVTAPNVTSGASTNGVTVWTQANASAAWGTPKFNTTYDNYAYADYNTPANTAVYRQWNIPTGMKSAYISQLQWSSGGYADVHGVQSDGGLVFLRRINTLQSVENANEGDPGQHDGSTITFIGSGLESYVAIRITNKLGRLHLTGLAFTPTLDGTEGTGMVHPQQLSTTLSANQIPTLNQNTTGSAGSCSGNSATASSCSGNSATASSCSGNSATASSCSGNSATASSCSGNSATASSCSGNSATASSVTGKSSISKTAHASGANDYHLELYSGNTNDSSNEVSLRFHQGGMYWGQIRFRSSQFWFTNGSDNSMYAINTGALNSTSAYVSGTLTSTGRVTCAGLTSSVQGRFTSDLQVTGGQNRFVAAPNSDDNGQTLYVSIYSQYRLVALAGHFFSDERIKKNIKSLNTEIALSKLRKIRPVSYIHIDTGSFEIGFIAQEIKKELPSSTSTSPGFVGNINIMGTFSDKQTIKVEKGDTEVDVVLYTITLEKSLPPTFDVNEISVLQTTVVKGSESKTGVVKYDPKHCGKVESDGTVIKVLIEDANSIDEECVYKIYGTQVKDLHTLNYDDVFTVTTAALQEVDRQQQSDKVRITTLETQLQAEKTKTYDLRQKVELLEMSHGALVERIEALEKL